MEIELEQSDCSSPRSAEKMDVVTKEGRGEETFKVQDRTGRASVQ